MRSILISVLKQLEWIDDEVCHICYNSKDDGHTDFCELSQILIIMVDSEKQSDV
jgi:hypothetical protein